MKRLVWSLVALVVVASFPPVPTGAAGGLSDRFAHPPIHVRGKAKTSPIFYMPSQIRRAYGLDNVTSDGSGQVIAIVDAYDDPTIASDLQTFITQFGLGSMNGLSPQTACTVAAGPHPCFQKMFGPGPTPQTNSGWALEIALDVEWAHAIAPGADILLVEASTSSLSDLLGAVDVAVGNGAKAVSMSWGGPEFLTESLYDDHFSTPKGVTFTAASGDSGSGVLWPAASPYVVGVGGTTLQLDSSNNVISETAWSGSGGGISVAEKEPVYQTNFLVMSGGGRGVPDVSYVADPNTGVEVYDSTPYNGQIGWFTVGGTSVGTPQWAAIVALADQTRPAGSQPLYTTQTSSPFYYAANAMVYASNYRDITVGSNGRRSCRICSATVGYDFVTGLGSPLSNNLVPFLSGH
ncbi:MAG TPA: S53 family peptidase [bacterium]|nr:S53 family peptidase [bacterium]